MTETNKKSEAKLITIKEDGRLSVPSCPIIPYIEGDGIGPDIWKASRLVVDEAVKKCYKGARQIQWLEVLAGEKAHKETGEWLPEKTLKTIAEHKVAIKGPLTTPIGGGIRSLNVTIRQVLDLYACVRPVKYYRGVPSPMKHPEKLDVVIFRENTEDVYAGIEWAAGTPEVKKIIAILKEMGKTVREDSGIGIKPISAFGTKRLVRRAIRYAQRQSRSSVTIVHKGNIMKFTEGAFREWGYQLAAEEFAKETITWDEIAKRYDNEKPDNRILVKDVIADAMFQQLLLRPEDYSVIATPNLNGDYLSDAAAAQVGGLGIAPGANIGDESAVFEATHGTAPKYAGLDKVNPSSLILSAVMMLEHLGWQEAAVMIKSAIEETISSRVVTYDLARQIENATEVKCSEFASAIVSNMKRVAGQ